MISPVVSRRMVRESPDSRIQRDNNGLPTGERPSWDILSGEEVSKGLVSEKNICSGHGSAMS